MNKCKIKTNKRKHYSYTINKHSSFLLPSVEILGFPRDGKLKTTTRDPSTHCQSNGPDAPTDDLTNEPPFSWV